MFDQYRLLKAEQPDALLLYRMGDFYELFFEDAVTAAPILDIALTSRNRNDPEPIPMAGVPHHAVASYIDKLTEAGLRVAIAEQVEDPAKAKGLVKRRIVRVVTPGVTFDPTALPAARRPWLAAVCRAPSGKRSGESGYGLAFLDVSTGDLRVTAVGQLPMAVAELQRFDPRELLLGPTVGVQTAHELPGAIRSEVDPTVWDSQEALREVCQVLEVASVEGFGLAKEGPAVVAAAAVLRYARDQLDGRLGNVHRIDAYEPDGFMVVDDTTRRNLEITRTLIGNRRRGSLLGLMDRTATSMGSRRMADWLAFPLQQAEPIAARQRAVGSLVKERAACAELRDALAQVADIERISARVAQGTAHARDLAGLRRSLLAVPTALQAIGGVQPLAPMLPDDVCAEVAEDLAAWLVEEPPISITEGGLIRPEADVELAELTALALDGMTIIGRLEDKERKATKIGSLKIKRNKVFGYFIEITAAHLHKVPDRFLRKQTLSTCERYITPELKEIEEKVLSADERRKQLELLRFRELRDRVSRASERLQRLADALADLDVLAALAEVAVRHRWVAPSIEAEPTLQITGGRHPMVEASLDEERFVPNDVSLHAEERRLIVLTGPNMSGKSTVLRQTALVVLLAHVGSYVPAEAAQVGLCDRIFTRVGAADDLRRGQSTFMVEMSETAAILHNATERSLVVLDEIGRGTSTFDGLAIAWAVAEDLVDRIGCRAMFATHYHELCELAQVRGPVVNQSVAVTESDGQILFLRRLKEGGASRSYGIQCARIAGLPKHVTGRAAALLTHFEKHTPAEDRAQLMLFAVGGHDPSKDEEEEASPTPAPLDSALRAAVQALDPDEMSPRQAHQALYALRELLEE